MKQHRLYRFFRFLIGIGLRFKYNIKVIGRDNLPKTGPVLLASNHQAFADSVIIPVSANRVILFLAKDQYFVGKGPIGAIQRWFFSLAAVPVNRDDKASGNKALESGKSLVIKDGEAFFIYPEGTRAPDQKVYRGNRGIIILAWETDVPVVPVALTGTAKPAKDGKFHFPRRRKVTVRFDAPMVFVKPKSAKLTFQANKAQAEQARELMEHIAGMIDWSYVDTDARMLKKEIERRETEIKKLRLELKNLKSAVRRPPIN
jgi:1-acyl-sn-glycerol-3-phosphate acyltransferase